MSYIVQILTEFIWHYEMSELHLKIMSKIMMLEDIQFEQEKDNFTMLHFDLIDKALKFHPYADKNFINVLFF